MTPTGVVVSIGTESFAIPRALDHTFPFWYTAADRPIFFVSASNSPVSIPVNADWSSSLNSPSEVSLVKTGAGNGLVTFTLSAETGVSVGAGIATAAGAAGAAIVGVGSFVGAGAGAGVDPGVGSDAVWSGRTVGSLRTVGVGAGCVEVGSGEGAGVAEGCFFSGEGSSSTEAIMLSWAGVPVICPPSLPLLQASTVSTKTVRRIQMDIDFFSFVLNLSL